MSYVEAERDLRVVRDALIDRAFRPGEGWRTNGRPFGWMLDCREIVLAPDTMPALGRLLYELAEPFGARAVAGTGVSGAPLVSAVVLESARRGGTVSGIVARHTAKAYGRRRQLEGPLPPPGSRVVVVDDVESSGATIGWVAEVLRKHRLVPVAAVTIVTFERAIQHRLAHDEFPRRHLFTLDDLGITASAKEESSPWSSWRLGGGNTGQDKVPLSRPVRDGNLVVAGTNRGRLIAMTGSGESRWQVMLGDPPAATHCTPVFTQHGVVIGADDGMLRCFDRNTGILLWQTPCGDRVGAGLVVDPAGRIVVPATSLPARGALVAVDARDGAVAWRRPLTGYAHAGPAATGEGAIGADNSGAVTAVAVDGEIRWRRNLGAAVKADLVVDEGSTCYAASFDGVLTALDAAHGRVRWRRTLGRCLYTRPLISGDRVHVAGDEHLFAIDCTSGRLIWVQQIGHRARGAITRLADGTLAVGSLDGYMCFVSDQGRPMGTFFVSGPVTSGAILPAENGVVVSATDGQFYAVHPTDVVPGELQTHRDVTGAV
jgi:outer membrane protein assembly factor BamB/orotate phosphoribosyltransferase